jgi:hypothetical protein
LFYGFFTIRLNGPENGLYGKNGTLDSWNLPFNKKHFSTPHLYTFFTSSTTNKCQVVDLLTLKKITMEFILIISTLVVWIAIGLLVNAERKEMIWLNAKLRNRKH